MVMVMVMVTVSTVTTKTGMFDLCFLERGRRCHLPPR